MHRLFTSESVTEGHPDKICDQIADSILDALLLEDPDSRVACECIAATGMVTVFGQITTKAYIDIPKIVRDRVREIGYTRGKFGFDADNLSVLTSIDEQSPDIAMGVDDDKHDQGAGDQGIMFGYATDETSEYMPMSLVLAHKLAKQLTKVRKDGTLPYLRPDGKTQVTVEYDEFDRIVRIDTVLVSSQHAENVSLEELRSDIKKYVVLPIIPKNLIDENTKFLCNPTGRFVVGGPHGDSGLTGRKIIVDTYGGAACHGGGAFSGKDPSKVDRSAAYAARHIAKNIVASGIAKKCEIQLSYAIGVAAPVSIYLNTFNTAKVSDELILDVISKNFDLTPKGIINYYDLKKPIYAQVASYGHFGRLDLDLSWERLEKVDVFKKLLQ